MGTMVGHVAPDFKLLNQENKWVQLSEVNQTSMVMLAFYPRDFSPVCTRQLCNYQEAYDRFLQYGMSIYGVSPNAPEKHFSFKNKYQFAFDLLTDPKHETAKLYGLTSLFLLGGVSRAVLILGKGRRVLYRYVEPTTLTHRKPEELLNALDELKKKGAI